MIGRALTDSVVTIERLVVPNEKFEVPRVCGLPELQFVGQVGHLLSECRRLSLKRPFGMKVGQLVQEHGDNGRPTAEGSQHGEK